MNIECLVCVITCLRLYGYDVLCSMPRIPLELWMQFELDMLFFKIEHMSVYSLCSGHMFLFRFKFSYSESSMQIVCALQ